VLLGWLAVVGGSLWLFVGLFYACSLVIILGIYLLIPPPLGLNETFKSFYEHGPRLDMAAYLVWAFALLSFGVDTIKSGYRRLRPFRQPRRFEQPIAGRSQRSDLLFGCLRIIGGGVALLAVMFEASELWIEIECSWRGQLPEFAVNWLFRGVRAVRSFLGRNSDNQFTGTELLK
jgi:hypothetical protein